VSSLSHGTPSLVRCFAIRTLYRCNIEWWQDVVRRARFPVAISANQGTKEWVDLFSLAVHHRPPDCSRRVESRANKSMRSHPPAYSHLTSTCKLASSVSPHAAIAFTKIQPTVLQHQFQYDGLAIHACRTSPSHSINCSQRLGTCIAAIPPHQGPAIIFMGTD
jgi:hypothetical protein